eukprot:scaffold77457_cov66-Phaeocystis_antarctica.AAC.6
MKKREKEVFSATRFDAKGGGRAHDGGAFERGPAALKRRQRLGVRCVGVDGPHALRHPAAHLLVLCLVERRDVDVIEGVACHALVDEVCDERQPLREQEPRAVAIAHRVRFAACRPVALHRDDAFVRRQGD